MIEQAATPEEVYNKNHVRVIPYSLRDLGHLNKGGDVYKTQDKAFGSGVHLLRDTDNSRSLILSFFSAIESDGCHNLNQLIDIFNELISQANKYKSSDRQFSVEFCAVFGDGFDLEDELKKIVLLNHAWATLAKSGYLNNRGFANKIRQLFQPSQSLIQSFWRVMPHWLRGDQKKHLARAMGIQGLIDGVPWSVPANEKEQKHNLNQSVNLARREVGDMVLVVTRSQVLYLKILSIGTDGFVVQTDGSGSDHVLSGEKFHLPFTIHPERTVLQGVRNRAIKSDKIIYCVA